MRMFTPSMQGSSEEEDVGHKASRVKQTDLTTQALHTISHASGRTIIASALGLCAVLYALLGRFGLFLSGLLLGLLLRDLWESGYLSHNELERTRRQDASIDVTRKLLALSDSKWASGTRDVLVRNEDVAWKLASRQNLDFSAFSPKTSVALTELVDALMTNYVSYWYSPLVTDDSFPREVRQVMMGLILSFGTHQLKKRPESVFLDFLIKTVSVLIVLLGELSKALMTGDGTELETHEALQLYLDRSPESNLHSIVDVAEQKKSLLSIADDLLQSFVDPKTYNYGPSREFLRQILSNVVLETILSTISQPEWVNSWIVYLLEQGEPEIMNAIDVGVEHASVSDETMINTQTRSNISFDDATLGVNQEVQLPESERADSQSKAQSGSKNINLTTCSNRASRSFLDEARLTGIGFDSDSLNTPASSNDRTVGFKPDISKSNGMEFLPLQQDVVQPEARSMAEERVFTDFNQIVLPYKPVPDAIRSAPPLTLYQANITLLNDASSDRSLMKNKPQIEYLLQIEPASNLHSGWMVPRMYTEVEALHEYLFKIANVAGARRFTRSYQQFPTYRSKTKETFRQEIEKYLCDALSYEPLAESEGMKRFLDKDQGFQKSGGNKGALGFAAPVGDAFQIMGKGMLGQLNTATKGVAAGSQAMLEGVGGLFSNTRKQAGPKRSIDLQADSSIGAHHIEMSPKEYDNLSPSTVNKDVTLKDELAKTIDGNQASMSADQKIPARPSDTNDESGQTSSASFNTLTSTGFSVDTAQRVDSVGVSEASEIEAAVMLSKSSGDLSLLESRDTQTTLPLTDSSLHKLSLQPTKNDSSDTTSSRVDQRASAPLDESETRVAVELIFAAINELFSLSSVWNIRRTLLNAAKNYLIRPGNPSLDSIRNLLQSNIVDANVNDGAIAAHVRKLRTTCAPSEEETRSWPKSPNEEEKLKLRLKARQVLITKGMPQALTSVMGAAASADALGRLFDAIQFEKVNRGMMFAVLLQSLKASIN